MATSSERAVQIKDLVAEKPGINSRAVAKELDVSPATVSLVLAGLKDSGQVKQVRSGKGMGLHLTDQAVTRRLLTKRWA